MIAADPDGAEARHRQARRDRRVVVTAEPDGMGTLWAMLTATDAAGAFTWLTRLARGLGAEDPRSMDARRADILAALLNGRLLHNADTAPGEDVADTAAGDGEAAIAPDDGEGGAGDGRATGGSPDRTDGVSDSNGSASGAVVGWRVHAHPDGRLTWTTPTGHRHRTASHDYRPDPIPEPHRAEPDAEHQRQRHHDGADPDPPPF